MSATLLLPAAAWAPLALALALAIPRWRAAVTRFSALAAVPALALALLVQPGARLDLPWLLQHTVLELDEVGRVFLGFTSALWLAAGWYARATIGRYPSPLRFHIFFLLSMAGNFTLILAGDIPTFYLGFAVMGLTSAVLVVHHGDAEALRAGRIYIALAMLGEVLILNGFVFLALAGGTTLVAELHRGVFSPVALLLLLLGLGIKAGALSLHFWLPLAHPAAPVPASAVLSGAMIKAGLLGWIRFLPLGEATLPLSGYTLVAAGLGAAFLGTFVGVVQRNAKAVLAYSSVSQMGIITTGVGIGALRPDMWSTILTALLIYATHHALAKGSLFLGVGPAHAARSRLQRLVVSLGLLLPALALSGAPLTSGALAKLALKSNVALLPPGWAEATRLLLPLAAVGTTLKMIRFLWLVWPRAGALHEGGDDGRGIWSPWLALVAATFIGIWLVPGALGLLPAKLTLEKIWLATWPLLAGGALAAGGAWLRRRIPGDPGRWLPAGDIGVLWERLLARLGARLRSAPGAPRADEGEEPPRAATRAWSLVGARLSRVEERLRELPLAGAALLLLIGLLLWLVTER
jgi:formate hydrogenlyase subunit 3/multisubunit Na+/H+ antiporter MnhD subunit